MSIGQTNEPHPTYVLYDPKDGRILGRYRCFDAAIGSYVSCTPEDVRAAAAGASSQLRQSFEVLECHLTSGQEMRDVRVDVMARQIVPRLRDARPPKTK